MERDRPDETGGGDDSRRRQLTATFVDRVAVQAQEVRPLRVMLTILAFPFYLLGLLVGLVWVALAWCGAAVVVGVRDVRDRKQARNGTG